MGIKHNVSNMVSAAPPVPFYNYNKLDSANYKITTHYVVSSELYPAVLCVFSQLSFLPDERCLMY